MTSENFTAFSLDEIDAMLVRGEDRTITTMPEDNNPEDDLPDNFWQKAVWVEPKARKSVHLRLQPEVFEFFINQTGGKGHIAKMQAVLKAYADAHS